MRSQDHLATFVKVVRPFIEPSKSDVQCAKAYSKRQWKAPDWPWNRFVHAFASNGGVKHWDQNVERLVDTRYSWKQISKLGTRERQQRLKEATNPRWRYKGLFEKAFQRFRKLGGPAIVKEQYLRLKTPKERLSFWIDFPGIGDKYAREIPMRSYDPLFMNHFAVDARLEKLLITLFGKLPTNYETREEFFRNAAKKLGVKCWDLDTILFNNYDAIDCELKQRAAGNRKKIQAGSFNRPGRSTSLKKKIAETS